jgi:class 3 adenylate cyclase
MGVRLTVRVRLPDGSAVAGAQITGTNHDAWAKRHRQWFGTTDPSGLFTWENLDKGTLGDRYTFAVRWVDPGSTAWTGEVSERIRGPRELLVVLRREAPPVAAPPPARRLAAIMFTDIAGFTRLAQVDEARALDLLDRHRRMLRPLFLRHHGVEVKTIGDGFLVAFDSTLEAGQCALDIQEALARYNTSAPDGRSIRVRIGLHVGDVVHDGNDILGDAVNIASRILPLADPGGICVSEDVYAQVRSRLAYPFVPVDPEGMKATVFPVRVYKLVLEPGPSRLFPPASPAAADRP